MTPTHRSHDMTDTDKLREAIAAIFAEDDPFVGIGKSSYDKADRVLALAAAPQPAPVDREALVRLLQIITRNGSLDDGRTLHEVIADALLARGLRLPGDAKAERDAAFAAGQEEMRERAAETSKWYSDRLVKAIRALPIKPHP